MKEHFYVNKDMRPESDSLLTEIKYEITDNTISGTYVFANSDWNTKDALTFILDDFQKEAQEGMIKNGADELKAYQLSAITRATITLFSDHKFTISNITYLSEKDFQNILYYPIFEHILFNNEEFNKNVVVMGNFKLHEEIDYKNVSSLWKQQINSIHFSDEYILDENFTKSLEDKNPEPNEFTKLRDSIYGKPTEKRERRKQILFIDNLENINIKTLISIASEARPLNLSVILRIHKVSDLKGDLVNAIFGNFGSFFIGNLQDEEINQIINYIPEIDKNELKKLQATGFGFLKYAYNDSRGTVESALYLT